MVKFYARHKGAILKSVMVVFVLAVAAAMVWWANKQGEDTSCSNTTLMDSLPGQCSETSASRGLSSMDKVDDIKEIADTVKATSDDYKHDTVTMKATTASVQATENDVKQAVINEDTGATLIGAVIKTSEGDEIPVIDAVAKPAGVSASEPYHLAVDTSLDSDHKIGELAEAIEGDGDISNIATNMTALQTAVGQAQNGLYDGSDNSTVDRVNAIHNILADTATVDNQTLLGVNSNAEAVYTAMQGVQQVLDDDSGHLVGVSKVGSMKSAVDAAPLTLVDISNDTVAGDKISTLQTGATAVRDTLTAVSTDTAAGTTMSTLQTGATAVRNTLTALSTDAAAVTKVSKLQTDATAVRDTLKAVSTDTTAEAKVSILQTDEKAVQGTPKAVITNTAASAKISKLRTGGKAVHTFSSW